MKLQGNLTDHLQSTSADPVLESALAELITLDINLNTNNYLIYNKQQIHILKIYL